MPKQSRRKCFGQRRKGVSKDAKIKRTEADTPNRNRRTEAIEGKYVEMVSDNGGNDDTDNHVNVDENGDNAR